MIDSIDIPNLSLRWEQIRDIADYSHANGHNPANVLEQAVIIGLNAINQDQVKQDIDNQCLDRHEIFIVPRLKKIIIVTMKAAHDKRLKLLTTGELQNIIVEIDADYAKLQELRHRQGGVCAVVRAVIELASEGVIGHALGVVSLIRP